MVPVVVKQQHTNLKKIGIIDFDMIHLILGRQGSGKTLLLVKLAHDNFLRDRKVYSNVHLNFKYKPINYNDVVECNLRNCMVLLDEIHLLLSARRWQKKTNIRICDNFISMARKQRTDVYGATQTPRKVDVRFREEADYVYYCTKYVWDENKQEWIEVLHDYDFDLDTPIKIKIEVTEMETLKQKNFYFLGNPYFRMFDTYQIVKVRGLPDE